MIGSWSQAQSPKRGDRQARKSTRRIARQASDYANRRGEARRITEGRTVSSYAAGRFRSGPRLPWPQTRFEKPRARAARAFLESRSAAKRAGVTGVCREWRRSARVCRHHSITPLSTTTTPNPQYTRLDRHNLGLGKDLTQVSFFRVYQTRLR